jgi:hypothetical protein
MEIMSSFDRDKAWLDDHPTVFTAPKIRIKWDLAFAEMAAQHEDALLDDFITTNWDQDEWEYLPEMPWCKRGDSLNKNISQS